MQPSADASCPSLFHGAPFVYARPPKAWYAYSWQLARRRCPSRPWMLPVRSSIGQYFICSMCSACLPDWCLLVVRARGLAFLQDFIALSRMLDFLNRYELGRLLQASRVVVQYSAYDLEEFTESEIRHQEVVKFVLEQRRARVAPTTPAESDQEAETGPVLGWS